MSYHVNVMSLFSFSQTLNFIQMPLLGLYCGVEATQSPRCCLLQEMDCVSRLSNHQLISLSVQMVQLHSKISISQAVIFGYTFFVLLVWCWYPKPSINLTVGTVAYTCSVTHSLILVSLAEFCFAPPISFDTYWYSWYNDFWHILTQLVQLISLLVMPAFTVSV